MIKNFLRRYLGLPTGVGSILLTIYLANYGTKTPPVINTLLDERPEVEEELPSASPTNPAQDEEDAIDEGANTEDQPEEEEEPSEQPSESEKPEEKEDEPEAPQEDEEEAPEPAPLPDPQKPEAEIPSNFDLSTGGQEDIIRYIVKKVKDINKNTDKGSQDANRLINTGQASLTITSLMEALTQYHKNNAPKGAPAAVPAPAPINKPAN